MLVAVLKSGLVVDFRVPTFVDVAKLLEFERASRILPAIIGRSAIAKYLVGELDCVVHRDTYWIKHLLEGVATRTERS